MSSANVKTDPIAPPISSPKTRGQRVLDKQRAILDAARTTFNAFGYRKTTIAKIAKLSGVADGTLYLYFQSKEDLARAALADFYAELTRSAQEGVDALNSPRERVEFLAGHHMDRVMDNYRLLEVLPAINAGQDSYEGSALYKMNKAYVAVFDRVAKDGAAQGVFRAGMAAWTLRDIFYGSMDYAIKTLMLRDKKQLRAQFIQDLMTTLFTPLPPSALKDTPIIERLEAVAARLEAIK